MNKKIFIGLFLLILISIFGCAKQGSIQKTDVNKESPLLEDINTNVPTGASPDGPLDTALVEIKIISVKDDIAKVEINKIKDYNRYPDATYSELKVGDEIDVRIYSIAPGGQTSTKEAACEQGQTCPEPAKPSLVVGKLYLADMNFCKIDYISGLDCDYEGWSASLYPL